MYKVQGKKLLIATGPEWVKRSRTENDSIKRKKICIRKYQLGACLLVSSVVEASNWKLSRDND